MRKIFIFILILLCSGTFVFGVRDCTDLGHQYEDIKNEVRTSLQTWELIPADSPQKSSFSSSISSLLNKGVQLENDYNACITSIVEINTSVEENFKTGNAYFVLKQWDRAIESYKKIIDINPESYHAHYNIGSAYLNKKEYNSALEYYQHALYYARGSYQIRESQGAIDKLAGKVSIPKITEETFSNDPFSHLQYYINVLNIPEAWSKVSESKPVIVAVIDDGININHPDLTEHIWIAPNSGYGGNKVINFAGDELPDNFPTGEHGTMISGIIGATINNDIGIAGIAKNVQIMPLRVFDFKGVAKENNIIRAMRYAVDNHANIINLSLGQSQFSYSRKYDEIMKYAYERGVIVVIASGNGDVLSYKNTGINTTINPVSPVCNNGGNKHYSIGVESLNQSGARSSWSNYGACISFSAPGENIFSTSIAVFNQENGVDYRTDSGTSFSAPMISGIIALGYNQFGYVSPDTVYTSLQESLRVNQMGNYIIDASLYLDVLAKKQKIIALEQNLFFLTGKNSLIVGKESLEKLSDVDYLTHFGYISKKSSIASYKLNQYIPRQEVIALANQIANLDIPENYVCQNIFDDITSDAPNSWVCSAVESAYQAGIISKNSSYFGPENTLTLVEAMNILMRAGGIKVQKYSGGEFEPWKINVIGTAFSLGIVSRDFDFSPQLKATRGTVFSVARKISEIQKKNT